MAAKDSYHNQCVHSLQKDGWLITHDPLTLRIGKTDVMIDLGAEQVVGAEWAGERIAVAIKSFIRPSAVYDLEQALGQFTLYKDVLERSADDADRVLYLAVRATTYEEIFGEPIGKMLVENKRLRLVVFDINTDKIVQWIP